MQKPVTTIAHSPLSAARLLGLATLLSAALASPRSAHADFLTFNWSGGSGVDNAWYRPGNWFENAAPPTSPGAGDTVNLYFGNTAAIFPSIQPDYTISTLSFLAAAPAYTFDSGTLTLNGGLSQTSPNAQTFGNPIVIGASQTWTLAGGAGLLSTPGGVNIGSNTLTVAATGNRTLGGTFTGSGATFTKTGAADLALVSGFSGSMPLGNVNEGTLTVNAGASFAGTNFTIASGAGLTVAGTINSPNSFFTVNGGNTLAARGSATLQSGGTMTTSTIGINNNASFTQTGGANTITSSLVFQGAGGAASAGSYSLSGAASTLTTGVSVVFTGTAGFNQSAGTHTTGGLTLGDQAGADGAYTLSGGELKVRNADPMSTAVPTTLVGGSGAGTFIQTGGTHTTGRLVLADAADSTGSYTLSGAASQVNTSGTAVGRGGGGTFTQSNGAHTVSGDLSVAGTTGGSGTYTLSGGTLSATNTFIGNNGAGTFTQSGGTHTVGTLLQVANDAAYTLSGGTLSAPLVSVVGSGGTFNLNGGTLAAGGVSFGGNDVTFNFRGGTLQATADNTAFLKFPGAALVGNNGGALIDTNGHNVAVPVILAHDPALGAAADGGLTKTGAGTLTLTGQGASGETTGSSYTGGTRVNAGTLLVNANMNNPAGFVSAVGTGAVTVNSGGTLGGNGVVAGAVTVNAGGTLAPGTSPGRLTLRSSLTLENGSTLAIELGGTASGDYDQVILSDTLTLGGNLSVTAINNFALTAFQTFTILDNTSASPLVTEFANAPGGFYTDAAGNRFQVNYAANADGDGRFNDVTLTVVPVPEPGATALILLGLLGLARCRPRPRAV